MIGTRNGKSSPHTAKKPVKILTVFDGASPFF